MSDFFPVDQIYDETKLSKASGTTFAELWTFINSLTDNQKDELVITINTANRAGGRLIRTLTSQWEGWVSGQSSISVIMLTTTNIIYRLYKFDGSTPIQNIETLNSWSATYIE